jgi:cytoskeletal protein CcmA (bactofilin family)
MRCPTCGRELNVQDIHLAAETSAPEIVSAATIYVEHDARVQADLIAAHIEVRGRVLGNILASVGCILHPTAKVAGKILSRSIRIDPGAQIIGEIERVDTPLGSGLHLRAHNATPPAPSQATLDHDPA